MATRRRWRRTTAFLDEAGNSGADLLSVDQPSLTMAAVWLSDATVPAFTRALEALKRQARVPSDVDELHARRFLETRAAMTFVPGLLALLRRFHSFVCCTIFEKKFFICQHVVMEFLDPAYNPPLGNIWTHPLPIKVPLENEFYRRFSGETMDACGLAFRHGTGMRRALELAVRDSNGLHLDGFDIPRLLSGAFERIDELERDTAAVAAGTEDVPARGVSQSPNFPCYGSMLNQLENEGRRRRAAVRVVFDSSRQYDRTFNRFLGLMRDARPYTWMLGTDAPYHFGYDSVHQFKPATYSTEPLLVLPDLMATGFDRVANDAIAGRPARTVVDRVFGSLLRDMWRSRPMASVLLATSDLVGDRIKAGPDDAV